MEKTQADVIVQAILDPDLRAQEEIRRKRAVEAARLAQQHQVAWFILVGFGIGVAAAYFMGVRISHGGIWGGLAGSAIGWLIKRRKA